MISDQRVDGARLSSASWFARGAAEAGASVTRESQTAMESSRCQRGQAFIEDQAEADCNAKRVSVTELVLACGDANLMVILGNRLIVGQLTASPMRRLRLCSPAWACMTCKRQAINDDVILTLSMPGRKCRSATMGTALVEFPA